MPNNIDYSKWDHLDEYSSDSDSDGGEDANDVNMTTPRVTRLDAPSSVTFGGSAADNGSATVQASGCVSSATAAGGISSTGGAKKTDSASTSTTAKGNNPKQQTSDHHPTTAWTDRGGENLTEDGSRKLYWSQDRYSVTFHLELKEQEKATSVKIIDGILPYQDRHAAVGTTKPHLQCVGTDAANQQTITLLEGDLPHPVHYAEDEDEVEWQVITTMNGRNRYLEFTLHKAVPMQGMFVWWRRPLMQFPEITVDGRYDAGGKVDKSSEAFQQAWEEAHQIFKEKKRQEKAEAEG